MYHSYFMSPFHHVSTVYHQCKLHVELQGGPKTGLCLTVDNFATVGDRNACYVSKFSKFYLEKEY